MVDELDGQEGLRPTLEPGVHLVQLDPFPFPPLSHSNSGSGPSPGSEVETGRLRGDYSPDAHPLLGWTGRPSLSRVPEDRVYYRGSDPGVARPRLGLQEDDLHEVREHVWKQGVVDSTSIVSPPAVLSHPGPVPLDPVDRGPISEVLPRSDTTRGGTTPV